jgi:hypothetical protein
MDRRLLIHAFGIVAFFAALYVAFFAPVLFSDRLLAPGDACFVSYPHFYTGRALWSPYIFAGFPVMGDPQTMMWYPPALLFSLVPNSWNAFVISAYVLASSFAYGYVNRLTGSRFAGLLGGIVFGMSGFFMAHLGHTNIIHSAAWMPLFIWSLDELRERNSVTWMLAGAAAVANSILAGQPQFAVYTLVLGAFYVLVMARGARWGWAFPAMSLATVSLGLGLSALLLLPLLELQGQSRHASLPFYVFAGYNLPARQMPQLLFPYIFGGFVNPFTKSVLPGIDRGGGLTEATGFVGLVPLLLAGLGWALNRRRRVVDFWLVVAVLTVLLAAGKETPLCALLFRVPIYNKFRILARHFFEFSLAIAVLSGFGVVALTRLPLPDRQRWLLRATIGLTTVAACALVAFCLIYATGRYTKDAPEAFQRLSFWPWHNPSLLWQIVVVTAGLFILRRWTLRPGKIAAALLVLAIVLDVSSFGWFFEWHYDPVASAVFRPPAVLADYRNTLTQSGQRLIPLTAFGPSETAPPNRSQLWRIPSALGHSPLVLSRYCELLGIHSGGFSNYRCLNDSDRSLDLLATRYVLAPRTILRDGSGDDISQKVWNHFQGADRWMHVAAFDQTEVFENRRALPRAWVVPRVEQMPTEAVLKTIHESAMPDGSMFEPRQIALVEEPVDLGSQNASPTAMAEVTHLSGNRVSVRVKSTGRAFLVLSDAYYPGWRATINDRPAKVFRTDYALRGVIVPAGDHVVAFAFRPISFYAGATVSALSSLACAALVLWPFIRRRKLGFSGRVGSSQDAAWNVRPLHEHEEAA